jgi:hypothetical protein
MSEWNHQTLPATGTQLLRSSSSDLALSIATRLGEQRFAKGTTVDNYADSATIREANLFIRRCTCTYFNGGRFWGDISAS